MRDEKYRDFHKKLVPTVDEARIIGVRIPALRKYAKELSAEAGIKYLDLLPHHYIEENNLHAFIISGMKDFDEAMRRTEEFLPYIDNWATCDSFMPKVFKKHPDAVYEKVKQWLKSEHTYTVRYGLVTLLNNFLDGE
ncbi:MAG: DNA alkylation repair protein, partial [Clostridia bacterium]|nr:DNA alkylation repair protein [Clostridia bacterium]